MLRNKRLAVALVISAGLFAGTGLALVPEEAAQDLPYLGKYSESLDTLKVPSSFKLEAMYGEPHPNIKALDAVTDHDIRESTSLPSGLEIKALLTKGTPLEKARLTTVIYGPNSIDYSKLDTFADVMDSHGIIVLYNEERDDLDIEQWYTDVLKERPNTQSVMVNGSGAIGVDGDPRQGKTSKLIFHDGKTQIQLVSAAYTLPELIKMASTL